jgi:4'-phosphopantetheinyl transferase
MREKREVCPLQSVVISAPWKVVVTSTAQRQLLCKDESDRMTRFVRTIDADRFCAAHSLVRLALSAITGKPPASLEFSCHPGGKPYLKGADGVDFNLSHSGDWVTVGICRPGAIGVDLEEVRPEGFWRDIASSFMTPAEIERIPSDIDAWHFLRMWTAKEAAVKATGHGFAIPPNEISIGWHGGKPVATIAGRRLSGHLEPLDATHLLAVMTDQDDAPSLMIARDQAGLLSALAALRGQSVSL